MRSYLQLSHLVFPYLLILSAIGTPACVEAMSRHDIRDSIQGRTSPSFPDQPPSCPICAKDYPNISSCAEAAPVLQNFTNIIFNPGAFIDVIKCACVDTFQAVFPQCVDCFIQTGQEDILNTPNLPGVVDGMRYVCAVASSLLGNVSATDGETTPSLGVQPPSSTTTNGASLGLGQMMTVWVSAILVTYIGFLVL